MTETGILNRDIAAELSKLGHMDKLLITDAGLAVPSSVKVIDLSLDVNVPTILDILKVILKNFSVEKIILSKGTEEVSPTRKKDILNCFPKDIPLETVTHPFFRDELTKEVKFAIRSGDFTSFSNIILVSGGGSRWYSEK